MDNVIVYGRAGSGKTVLLKETIADFPGKVFYFGAKEEFSEFNKHLGINTINISDLDFNYLEDSFKGVDKTFKTFIPIDLEADPYFYIESLTTFIKFIQENIDKIEYPLLIAFDEFQQIDLSCKTEDNKSLFLNILELNLLDSNSKISTLFVLQNIRDIDSLYKTEYDKILDLCKTINTTPIEKYSGEIRLRLPRSLHQQLSENADIEGTSLNQYIIYLLTKQFEKVNCKK